MSPQSAKSNIGSSTIQGIESPAHKDSLKDLFSFLAILILLVVGIRSSVVGPYKIPSSSMVPTLQIGDHILVNKLSYGLRLPMLNKTVWQYSTPERGDIVVFSRPDDPETAKDDESQTNYIKRVIGLPGETVEVRGRTVYIDSKPMEGDSHAIWQAGGARDFGPETIPENHVFLMGDNRDQSRDSRFWSNGHFLDISFIKGRAFLIYYNSALEFKRMFKILQ